MTEKEKLRARQQELKTGIRNSQNSLLTLKNKVRGQGRIPQHVYRDICHSQNTEARFILQSENELAEIKLKLQKIADDEFAARHPVEPVPDAPAAAPKWYTADEMRHWLVRNEYAPNIADELCKQYADNLQKAFSKGFEMGQRGVPQTA